MIVFTGTSTEYLLVGVIIDKTLTFFLFKQLKDQNDLITSTGVTLKNAKKKKTRQQTERVSGKQKTKTMYHMVCVLQMSEFECV